MKNIFYLFRIIGNIKRFFHRPLFNEYSATNLVIVSTFNNAIYIGNYGHVLGQRLSFDSNIFNFFLLNLLYYRNCKINSFIHTF